MNTAKTERRFQPAQFLAISFAGAIFVGAFFFLLPFSTKSGHISFIDALFRATSSICVTGLITQDTATFLTRFGQAVNIMLVQLGGLGIMTFSTLILFVAGKRISIKDRIIIQQGFHHAAPKDVKSLIKNVFLYTMTIELVGALLLFIRWHRKFPVLKGLFFSVFHSISAFCNAGFALFSDSFVGFRNDVWINVVIILLIVFGGLGFLVLQEINVVFLRFVKRKSVFVTLHTKMVLTATLLLIVLSFVFFFLIEWNHSLDSFSPGEKIISSLFQVVTPRTAGFNTMDLNTLSFASIFLLITLMFVGASPGSTGGGVKTSTVGVILAFLKSKIAARDSASLFYRTLSMDLVTKAFTVIILALCLVSVSTFILFITQPGASMQEVVFEVFSAFGTVGLSLGMTPKLNTIGKIVIILTMYIGRIGPLTLLYALSRERAIGRYEYAEETVMIG